MRQQFTKMLIGLASIFSKELNAGQVKFYADIVEETFGFEHDWQEISRLILMRERFFPVPAVLGDYVREVSKIADPQNEAEDFVDKAIFYFQNKPKEAYEALGKEGYNLAKSMGLDPYSIRSGLQNVAFLRKQWIENYTILKREREQYDLLPSAIRPTLLKGGQDDKADK